jgi:hypothetical protein
MHKSPILDPNEPHEIPPWDDPDLKIEYSIISARKDILRLEASQAKELSALRRQFEEHGKEMRWAVWLSFVVLCVIAWRVW